jgi:hypothetical protein
MRVGYSGVRCKYCKRPHLVSWRSAQENPFCKSCLPERIAKKEAELDSVIRVEADGHWTVLHRRGESKMKVMPQLQLSLLLFKEGDFWIAQCLQHNIASQGSTISEAKDRFERVFAAQAITDSRDGAAYPIRHIPQASHQFWKMWAGASSLCGTLPINCPVCPAMVSEIRVC